MASVATRYHSLKPTTQIEKGCFSHQKKEEEGVRWGWWGKLDEWMWMLIMMYLALNATFPTLPLNVCKPPADLVEQRSPKGRGTIFPRKISVGVGNGMGWCQCELREGEFVIQHVTEKGQDLIRFSKKSNESDYVFQIGIKQEKINIAYLFKYSCTSLVYDL